MTKVFCFAAAIAAFMISGCMAVYASIEAVPEPSTVAVLVGIAIGAIVARKALKRK